MNAEMAQLQHRTANKRLHTDLLTLQARQSAMHESKLLLTELEHVENAIADGCSEACVDDAAGDADDDSLVVQQLVALSARFLVDRAFARQLRRLCRMNHCTTRSDCCYNLSIHQYFVDLDLPHRR